MNNIDASLNRQTLVSSGEVDVEGSLQLWSVRCTKIRGWRLHDYMFVRMALYRQARVGCLVISRAPSLTPPSLRLVPLGRFTFDLDGFHRLDPEPLPPVTPF